MPKAMRITHAKGHGAPPAKDEKKPGQAGLREGWKAAGGGLPERAGRFDQKS